MKHAMRTNRHQSWWGPKLGVQKVQNYKCPYNLTVDSSFNSSSHCPVNSFLAPYSGTSDMTIIVSSSDYTLVNS